MKRVLYLIVLCVACVSASAQTVPTLKPDLQTIDDGFFDPTKEPEKVREPYEFKMEYRIEAGYIQSDQRVPNDTARFGFQHGARLGATFTFVLPLRFSLETGLIYSIAYGRYQQHYRSQDVESIQAEYLEHRNLSHNLTIPVRAYYTIPLWKKLNMFLYTGPQLQIGLAQKDYVKTHLSPLTYEWLESEGVHVTPYDRYHEGELQRVNIQYGLGGGLEWDCYRLKAGYDFGLNDLIKRPIHPSHKMWEWQWNVCFSYRF